MISNEVQSLYANLLFENKPEIDDYSIEKELSLRFKNIDFPKENGFNRARIYVFKDYVVNFQDGETSASCSLFKPDSELFELDKLENAYQQMWHWPIGQKATKNCKHELLLIDLMSRPLEYKQRVDLFQGFVFCVSKVLDPKGIYFPSSEKLVETSQYQEWVLKKETDYLDGLLNIRLFSVEGNELIMDTLGLNTLGLPDFQIRFSNYDPSLMAGLLHSYSNYIYQNGSIIENGNTIKGLKPGSKFNCFYSSSWIGPSRKVIEIVP